MKIDANKLIINLNLLTNQFHLHSCLQSVVKVNFWFRIFHSPDSASHAALNKRDLDYKRKVKSQEESESRRSDDDDDPMLSIIAGISIV